MSWKVIKRGLFVTMEGIEREGHREECTEFMFKHCINFDTSDCIDYWSTCWEKFHVKIFNKVIYEGEHQYDAEYVYDISEMKHLLIIIGTFLILTITLILNFFPNL